MKDTILLLNILSKAHNQNMFKSATRLFLSSYLDLNSLNIAGNGN